MVFTKNASPKNLIIIFLLMFGIILLSSKVLIGLRMDLTEHKLYTLSDGTRNILSKLENPVTLTLYFSDKATQQLPALRTYAQRVIELIGEYETLAKGKLVFKQVDPEPFSEAEDEAALAGLQGVPGSVQGDEIYFGLVAKNDQGAQEVIPFMQPGKEAFLEYDLTSLIASLSKSSRPKIAIYSGVDLKGGYDYMTQQQKPEWHMLSLLQDNFELEWIDDAATSIEGADALLLVAPQNLPDGIKFAVDQYVMAGGKTMVFLDPFVESMMGMSQMPSVQRADLADLLPIYGIKLRENEFVTDFTNSMVVGVGQDRQAVRHIGLLGMNPDALNSADIALQGLESVNWSSVGILDAVEGTTAIVTPLIQSSDQSQPRDPNLLATLQNPETLLKEFAPTGERYTIAARVTGSAKTAFPDGLEIKVQKPAPEDAAAKPAEGEAAEAPKMIEVAEKLTPTLLSTDKLQLLVVADSDVLTDRLWVQAQEFFGQRIVSAWADNGSFLLNALEHLSGNEDLLSIRSQGRFNRPFDKVEALRREAEERFLKHQESLQQELSSTEEKLVALEQARKEGDGSLFTPEQEAELVKFQEEKLKIRKQLRDVQHQLDQDIEMLGTNLKLLNIFLIPALICILLLIATMRRRVA